MRHRPARLDHQAGSLLPELRGVLPTLARHTDNLPAGPAVLPVRCAPSGVNPNQGALGVIAPSLMAVRRSRRGRWQPPTEIATCEVRRRRCALPQKIRDADAD